MWHNFTKAVMNAISMTKDGVIFMCWDKEGLNVCQDIDQKKHHVLTYDKAIADAGETNLIDNNTNFSKVNEILEDDNKESIDWNLD